jgi:hypothetical protein
MNVEAFVCFPDHGLPLQILVAVGIDELKVDDLISELGWDFVATRVTGNDTTGVIAAIQRAFEFNQVASHLYSNLSVEVPDSEGDASHQKDLDLGKGK